MPPRDHYPDRKHGFDFRKSEVIQHIEEQFGVSQFEAIKIFTRARKRKIIVFDATTRMWEGAPGSDE